MQEYKDRKEYDLGLSHFHGSHVAVTEDTCACDDTVGGVQPEDLGSVRGQRKATLFTRTTYPNCRVAEKILDKAGFDYENLTAEEHPELCRQYGIKGAPTMIITDGEHFEKYYGVAEIKKLVQDAGQKVS